MKDYKKIVVIPRTKGSGHYFIDKNIEDFSKRGYLLEKAVVRGGSSEPEALFPSNRYIGAIIIGACTCCSEDYQGHHINDLVDDFWSHTAHRQEPGRDKYILDGFQPILIANENYTIPQEEMMKSIAKKAKRYGVKPNLDVIAFTTTHPICSDRFYKNGEPQIDNIIEHLTRFDTTIKLEPRFTWMKEVIKYLGLEKKRE